MFFQFPIRNPKRIDMLVARAKKPKQYFLAVVPPPPVYAEALQLKHYFKEHYNSKASLNSPPHITLHMPFQWKEEKESDLIGTLEKFSPGITPFPVCLENFGSFPPRVIFIDVVPNDHLMELQKKLLRFCKQELNIFNADYKDQPFHPHLTLAFRDLKKSIFADAWREFGERDFKAEFLVKNITVLKHNGRVWEIFREIPLK